MEQKFLGRYRGLLAEIYDVEQNWTLDIGHYVKMASFFGDPILELGTGTGRILLPLAKSGYRVFGLDNSQSMLDILQEKRSFLDGLVSERVQILKADMRNFNLDAKFRFIFMAYNTLSHLDEKGMVSTFKCVSDHLFLDGVFVVSSDVPDFSLMRETSGKNTVYEHYHPKRESVVETSFTSYYNLEKGKGTDVIRVKEFKNDKLVKEEIYREDLFFYLPERVKKHLENTGFFVEGEYGSFLGDPLLPSSPEMVFVAKKKVQTA